MANTKTFLIFRLDRLHGVAKAVDLSIYTGEAGVRHSVGSSMTLPTFQRADPNCCQMTGVLTRSDDEEVGHGVAAPTLCLDSGNGRSISSPS